MAEHSISKGHGINFNDTSIIDRTSGYVNQLVKEATEVNLNKNNFNTDGNFIWSQAWSPITNMLINVKAGQTQ